MQETGLKGWFLRNFVRIAEVLGYMLSLSIIGGALYTLFVHVDVTVDVSGELAPAANEIVAETRAVVVEMLAEPATDVAADAPLLSIVTTEAAIRRAIAQSNLDTALTLLAEDPDIENAAMLDSLRAMAEEEAPEVRPVTLRTPAGGLFIPAPPTLEAEAVEPGEPMGIVYDLSRLKLTGAVIARNGERIEVGMPARASHDAADGKLVGEVATIAPVDGQYEVVLVFADTPPAVRAAYRDALTTEGEVALPTVNAKVVVGQQTLFTKLFSKRQ